VGQAGSRLRWGGSNACCSAPRSIRGSQQVLRRGCRASLMTEAMETKQAVEKLMRARLRCSFVRLHDCCQCFRCCCQRCWRSWCDAGCSQGRCPSGIMDDVHAVSTRKRARWRKTGTSATHARCLSAPQMEPCAVLCCCGCCATPSLSTSSSSLSAAAKLSTPAALSVKLSEGRRVCARMPGAGYRADDLCAASPMREVAARPGEEDSDSEWESTTG